VRKQKLSIHKLPQRRQGADDGGGIFRQKTGIPVEQRSVDDFSIAPGNE
jgi:hypothetical protein